MGLFDDSSSRKGEVRIGVADEDEADSKLRNEVESKIDQANSSKDKEGSQKVSKKDLERQNERIINLLEQLVDDEEDSGNRVTDRKNDNGVRGGMDELL